MAADVIIPEISRPQSKVVSESFQLSLIDAEFESSPLHSAVVRQNPRFLLRRLQLGDNPHARDAEFQTNYLHLLLENARIDRLSAVMVYQLSNAGLSVNETDYRGRTALEMAAEKQLPSTMIALLRAGADPKRIQSQNQQIADILNHFKPGLWQAVKNNDVTVVDKLVQSWCRIQISRDGESLLKYANENRADCRIISKLKENRASCEYAHAALAGDLNRLIELIPNRNISIDSYVTKYGDLRQEVEDLGQLHLIHLVTKTGMKQELDKLTNQHWPFGRSPEIKQVCYQNISRLRLESTAVSNHNQSEICVIL